MKHYIILITKLFSAIIFNPQIMPHNIVNNMVRGINLGNVFSAPAENGIPAEGKWLTSTFCS